MHGTLSASLGSSTLRTSALLRQEASLVGRSSKLLTLVRHKESVYIAHIDSTIVGRHTYTGHHGALGLRVVKIRANARAASVTMLICIVQLSVAVGLARV